MRKILLNNEVEMPIEGLGTFKIDKAEVYKMIRWAVKLGVYHFDCASIYGNEEEVGFAIYDALNEDNIKREELFITSKLWNDAHSPKDVEKALDLSLKNLGVEYLDLFLIHWPVAQVSGTKMPNSDEDMLALDDVLLIDTWKELEKLYRKGKVRAIGVSNFGIKNLSNLLQNSDINPMVNQIERHPYLQQNELLDWMKKNNIAVTAHTPLGGDSGKILSDSVIVEIASKNNVSPAEVCLAWNMLSDVVVIPKAYDENQLKENVRAINLKLDADDVKKINELDKNMRFVEGNDFRRGWYKNLDIFE